MARTKRGTPPLFELLDQGHLRRGNVGPQPDLRLVRPEPEESETVRSAPRFRAPDAIIETRGNAPWLQLLGDRLHVSLTPTTAAVGVFVISIVILGAVFLGKMRGERAALEKVVTQAGIFPGAVEGVEVVREQPPATHLVESLLVGNAPAPASPSPRKTTPPALAPAVSTSGSASASSRWTRDFTYIVVQEFGAGREADAVKAREFLAAKGFPAEIVTYESGAIQLITLEGFDHRDPAQKKKSDEILKKQRAAGAEYWASGGGYKLEGYYKTLKKDRW